jgi:hypothetical protein
MSGWCPSVSLYLGGWALMNCGAIAVGVRNFSSGLALKRKDVAFDDRLDSLGLWNARVTGDEDLMQEF